MARERTGFITHRQGRLYARVGYTDQKGKRRDRLRRATNRTHAKHLIRDIIRELENDQGEQLLDATRMTFADLATYFERHYLKPAEYVDDRKVDGVRSVGPAKSAVNALRDYFGKRRLQGIRYSDLRAYRAARLRTPVLRGNESAGRQRSIASVNRELSKLRRMFSIAQREGWIKQNPFAAGESLISLADEKKRERILTGDEERRLLSACVGPRAHLRPILICAIDTGMRRGEIISLRWSDVDFEHRLILIQAFNAKTARAREVSMTIRLTRELEALWEQSPKDARQRVFGILDNVKRSFTAARNAAGLPDVRFHDLRHTAATRLVSLHIPLAEVSRQLGHSNPSTTFRYVNRTLDTARRASAALDAFNAENQPVQEATEAVN